MIIKYKFNGNLFDYEVEHDRYLVAMFNILLKEEKENLIKRILDFDGCVVNLYDDYEEELKEYFGEMAYKEYLEGRN